MADRDTLDEPSIGACPRCHSGIPESNVVIDFRLEHQHSIVARCGNCGDVVNPRR